MKQSTANAQKMKIAAEGRNFRWFIPQRRALSARGDKTKSRANNAGQINKEVFCFFETNDADFYSVKN
jgi:hypothetical protein